MAKTAQAKTAQAKNVEQAKTAINQAFNVLDINDILDVKLDDKNDTLLFIFESAYYLASLKTENKMIVGSGIHLNKCRKIATIALSKDKKSLEFCAQKYRIVGIDSDSLRAKKVYDKLVKVARYHFFNTVSLGKIDSHTLESLGVELPSLKTYFNWVAKNKDTADQERKAKYKSDADLLFG